MRKWKNSFTFCGINLTSNYLLSLFHILISGECDNDRSVTTVANPGKQAWKPQRKAQALCRLLGDQPDPESWKRADRLSRGLILKQEVVWEETAVNTFWSGLVFIFLNHLSPLYWFLGPLRGMADICASGCLWKQTGRGKLGHIRQLTGLPQLLWCISPEKGPLENRINCGLNSLGHFQRLVICPASVF